MDEKLLKKEQEEFEEMTNLLNEIQKEHKSKDVFIKDKNKFSKNEKDFLLIFEDLLNDYKTTKNKRPLKYAEIGLKRYNKIIDKYL